MSEKIFTKRTDDYCYQFCQCNACGVVRRCTPSFDFFSANEDPERFLYCERCFMAKYCSHCEGTMEIKGKNTAWQIGDDITVVVNGVTKTGTVLDVDEQGRPCSFDLK